MVKNELLTLRGMYFTWIVCTAAVIYFNPELSADIAADYATLDILGTILFWFVVIVGNISLPVLLYVVVILMVALPTHHAADWTTRKLLKYKGNPPLSVDETFMQLAKNIIGDTNDEER